MNICIYTCIYLIFIHTLIVFWFHKYVCVYVYMRSYVCIYVCIYMCIYVYMCMYVYIHILWFQVHKFLVTAENCNGVIAIHCLVSHGLPPTLFRFSLSLISPYLSPLRNCSLPLALSLSLSRFLFFSLSPSVYFSQESVFPSHITLFACIHYVFVFKRIFQE